MDIDDAQIEVVEVDFLKPETLENIPKDISGAYYLMHSMSNSNDYAESEKQCAINFSNYIENLSLITQVFWWIQFDIIVIYNH